MPRSSWGRCERMFAVLLGMLHMSLVDLLSILSNFLMSSLENGNA
jgi:hypothetical protein